jgi:hypothetical protein
MRAENVAEFISGYFAAEAIPGAGRGLEQSACLP